jgi:hypothetical protein
MDPAEGRPRGLYGNEFARASADAVRRATTPIDPPTRTNLIAMAAPSGGYGAYTAAQIEHVLATAFTGFRAASLESKGRPVAVHTGYWGCGAFGGNRTLMVLLQHLAAEIASLDALVIHTGAPGGDDDAREALVLRAGLGTKFGRGVPLEELLGAIASLGFEWGEPDGN